MKARTSVLALAIIGCACTSSYADTPRSVVETRPEGSGSSSPGSRSALAVEDSAPYRVEVLGASFRPFPTYYANGRSYVMGSVGDRYRIHITNPLPRRVEAVVSVDGLDAIDGKTADLTKRGYILPPYGEVTIDGFRTSLDQVATFRFSSVQDSYAGRKGQDRNVGVIGVAFFPERHYQVRSAPLAQDARPREEGADDRRDKGMPSSASTEAPAPQKSGAARAMGSQSRASRPRAGLGTEFGERRYSSVEYTTFERENARPDVVNELRYNDRQGLAALDIPVPGPDATEDDLSLCETAAPFPQNRFASPPPAR